MDWELEVLKVKIFDDQHAMVSYTDKSGRTYQNSGNLTVKDVADIFRKAKRPENIPPLEGVAGGTTVPVEVVLDDFLANAFGFNEVGEIVPEPEREPQT